MTFEMSITKKRPTSEGVEEYHAHIKNEESLLNGDNLLDILRIALDAPSGSEIAPEPTPQARREPTIALLSNEVAQNPEAPEVKKYKATTSAPVAPRPKKVDLLGTKDSGFTIADRLAALSEEPKPIVEEPKKPVEKPVSAATEPIDTNPDRRVKIWVNCTECDFEGDKGTYLHKQAFRCPKCHTLLHIIDATEVHGAKDDKGYVRLAQDRHYTAKEKYEYKQARLAEEF